MILYAIIDLRSLPDHPLGDTVETVVRREDAERFIEGVSGDDSELAGVPADRGARARAGGLN